jgi:hypothetical protein
MNYFGIPLILLGIVYLVYGVQPNLYNEDSNIFLKMLVGRVKICWGDNWPAGFILYGVLLGAFGILTLVDVWSKI